MEIIIKKKQTIIIMKYIIPTFLLLLSTLLVSTTQAAPVDSTISYTPKQIESIVAAEVQRQVDNTLIGLKIDKAVSDKMGTYINAQSISQDRHDYFIGGFFVLIGIILGVVGPWWINKQYEDRIKDAEYRISESEKSMANYKQNAEELHKQIEELARMANEFYQAAEKSAEKSKNAAKVSELLIQANSEKNIDKRIELLTHALEIDRYNIVILMKRGSSYQEKGEYDNAVKDFDKTIKLRPKYVDAYISRGVAYENKGEYGNAMNDYEMAIKLEPNDPRAYINRGNIYMNNCETIDKAIGDYSRAIKLKPDYSKAFLNLGLASSAKSDFKSALIIFNKGKDVARIKNDNKMIEKFDIEIEKANIEIEKAKLKEKGGVQK